MFPGSLGIGPGLRSLRRRGQSTYRLSGFLRTLEGRRCGCSDPENGEGGVREVEVAWFYAERNFGKWVVAIKTRFCHSEPASFADEESAVSQRQTAFLARSATPQNDNVFKLTDYLILESSPLPHSSDIFKLPLFSH